MIVCQCQNITDRDIDAAIDWMRASDPRSLITPGRVYHALGKAADCGGCMPLFLSTMRRNGNLQVPATVSELKFTDAAIATEGEKGCKATRRSSNT